MSDLSYIDTECIRCGLCAEQQSAEGMPAFCCGDLAQHAEEITDLSELDPDACAFLLSCTLCDNCTARCPQHLSCALLVRAGREKLHHLWPDLADSYRAFRVEYEENMFTLLRKTAGFEYKDPLDSPDASEHSAEEDRTLFFPGCALAAYSQELTNAVYELLEQKGVVQGMSVHCCGKPLGDMGKRGVSEKYGQSLLKRLRSCGITRLVAACPNCYYELQALLQEQDCGDIVVDALPEVLLGLGIAYEGSEFASIALHDSCPDRFEGRFGNSVRALFASSEVQIVEMAQHGVTTICCGTGGFSRTGNPSLSTERRSQRFKQFTESGAECLVSYCANCASYFASEPDAPLTRHYLELLLDIPLDWPAVERSSNRMFTQEGRALELPLEESTPVFDD